jgi:ribose 5-phosphate isomerase B
MRVALAFDHRGIELRGRLLAELEALGHEVVDLGTDAPSPRIDYPDKARELAHALTSGAAERGILVCSSGVGAAIAACKFAGIRACVCHDVYTAHQGVEHDDMNVLCLGSEIVGNELAAELARTFLAASFDGGERYRRRLDKISEIERGGRVHDVSVPIRPGMHIYRGNPGVRLERHESISDGAHANVSRLELGVHSGTHVDGALHFIDGGPAPRSCRSTRCSARQRSWTRAASTATSTTRRSPRSICRLRSACCSRPRTRRSGSCPSSATTSSG